MGGVLAIVGGVVANQLSFDQQQELEGDRTRRAARAAARVLWIEYGSRIDDLEEFLYLENRGGDPVCGNEDRPAGFDCQVAPNEKRVLRKPLKPIVWPLEDRRILAIVLTNEEWVSVAGAHIDWTRLVEEYRGKRGRVIHSEELSDAVNMKTYFIEAQDVLRSAP